MLLFDKNLHIIILTKKKLFFTRDTNYFTLPLPIVETAVLPIPRTVLPTFKFHRFWCENQGRKILTNQKSGRLKRKLSSAPHKSGISCKSSQSRWECNPEFHRDVKNAGNRMVPAFFAVRPAAHVSNPMSLTLGI